MTLEQKEDLRHALLEYLVKVHPAAVRDAQIKRNLEKLVDFKFDPSDLDSALTILLGVGFAQFQTDGLGTTKYWCATAKGVLDHERNA